MKFLRAVIYSAVEEKSPYHHLTDYIQYVIIVKDSDPAAPFLVQKILPMELKVFE